MAVATSTTYVTYHGNGSTATPYPVTFAFLSATHLEVRIKPSGGSWIKIATNQWEISSNSLRIISGPVPNTTQVKISRCTPVAQPNRYTVGGVFPAASHEAALDRLTLMIQERTAPYFNSGHRPIVTGGRDGNTALASLLAQLANIGLITNETTAAASDDVGNGISLLDGPPNSGRVNVMRNGVYVGFFPILT